MRLQSSDPIFACHNTLPATKMTMMIVMTRVTNMMMMMMNLTTTVNERLLCFLSFPPPTVLNRLSSKVVNGRGEEARKQEGFNFSPDLPFNAEPTSTRTQKKSFMLRFLVFTNSILGFWDDTKNIQNNIFGEKITLSGDVLLYNSAL